MNPITRRFVSPLIAIAAALTLHCQSEPSQTPPTDTTAAVTETAEAPTPELPTVGTKLGADGHVAERKEAFARDEPIWLTFQIPADAVGTQIEVMVRDAGGEEIKSVFPPSDAAKLMSVPLRDLEPGRYTAEGLWKDEKHWEVAFEIRQE